MKEFFEKLKSCRLSDILGLIGSLVGYALLGIGALAVAVASIPAFVAYWWPKPVAWVAVQSYPGECAKKWRCLLYKASSEIQFLWGRFEWLPMKERRFFIDRMVKLQGFDLKNLSEEEQVAYFLKSEDEKKSIFPLLSQGAQLALCKRKKGQYLKEIASYGTIFSEDFLQCFFLPGEDIEEKKLLLKELAKDGKLTGTAVDFIVDLYVGDAEIWGKLASQISTAEEASAAENEAKRLAVPTVKDLLVCLRLTTKSLEILLGVLGEEDAAYPVLAAWQKKNTFPSVIVDKLIDFSTSNILDDRQSRAWSLLQQHLSQNWATEEQIQRLSQKADGSQASMLNQILLVRRGLAAVKNGAGAWENYLRELRTLELTAAPLEVQKKMNFEQYKAYHKVKGLVLLPEVFDFLLLSLKESDKDFFETLVKEQNEAMGDASEVLPTVMLVPWKRDSLLKLKEDNDGGLPL